MSSGETEGQSVPSEEPTGREVRDARREAHETEKQHRATTHKGSNNNEKRGRKGKASKGNKGSKGAPGHQHGQPKEPGPP